MRRRIVVVGAGATAASLLMQLSGVPGIDSIDLIAPGTAGLGTAFGATDPSVLCNTSVDVTSLTAHGTSDLLRYLAARGHPVGRDDFVPRYLVGQYARERLTRALQQLRSRGVRTRHVRSRVTGVAPGNDGRSYDVSLAGGHVLNGTDIALCLGADAPALPPALQPHTGSPQLLDSPYPTNRLTRLPDDARVLVLGSKLSAIDAGLVLCRSPRRRVTLTSPSAVLPAVRTRLRRMPTMHISSDDWRSLHPDDPEFDGKLARRLVRAVRRASPGGTVPRPRTAGTAEELLRRETQQARTGAVAWQDVMAELIDALNAHTCDWTQRQRDAFFTRHRPLIARYISAIPLPNAELLLSAMERRQLTVAPAQPRSLTPGPQGQGWHAHWPDGRDEHFDHLVCATGYRAPRLAVADGTLLLDAPGGTPPAIGTDLRIRLRSDGHAERIWALGACAGSRYPIVNYLRASAQHAENVAAQIRDTPQQLPLALDGRTSP
ncbi:FAD/NAD(P)-binding protein [Streptomyces olivaceiscleroticus]|uniref:FAD/NAD(P)-binding protein n=1 Tax=Streptomyces olivaceiscleroticus TaxID=68245 RepID=UPI0031F7FCB7